MSGAIFTIGVPSSNSPERRFSHIYHKFDNGMLACIQSFHHKERGDIEQWLNDHQVVITANEVLVAGNKVLMAGKVALKQSSEADHSPKNDDMSFISTICSWFSNDQGLQDTDTTSKLTLRSQAYWVAPESRQHKGRDSTVNSIAVSNSE